MQYQVSTNKNMQSENKIRKYRLRAKLAVMRWNFINGWQSIFCFINKWDL